MIYTGGERVTDTAKYEAILGVLSGLKRYEWNRIEHAVNKKFSSMEANMELPSKEELLETFKHC